MISSRLSMTPSPEAQWVIGLASASASVVNILLLEDFSKERCGDVGVAVFGTPVLQTAVT